MIKRIIFDVDGTLICNVDFKEAISNTLKKLNIFSDDNLNKFISGISTYEKNFNSYNKKDYLNHFSKILEVDLKDDFLEKLFFEELKCAIPREFSGINEMLTNLSKKYELVILSNYFSRSQKNRLHSMNIDQFFSEFYGEKIIKPNSQAYIDACGLNKPEECVMVGDDINLDIKGALDNGLKAIFINTKKVDNLYSNVPELQGVKDITVDLIESL